MVQPSAGPGGPPPGTWAPAPPPRRRTGVWIAIACVLVVLVLGFLAVTGGVVYLVARGGGSGGADGGEDTGAETAQIQHEYFSFSYPADWFDHSDGEVLRESDGVAEVADTDIDPDAYDQFATDQVTVYAYDGTLHAEAGCRQQAVWIGFGWEQSEDPEELDPVTLGGRELPAHRRLGTHDGQDVVAELYCADVGDDVVEVVAETHGATELSPEVREILASWTWAEGAEEG